jgi:hypothetical protein
MRLLATLLAVIALFSVADAFWIYFPKYRCKQDDQCIKPPNSPRDEKDVVSAITSLKISQRWPKVVLP